MDNPYERKPRTSLGDLKRFKGGTIYADYQTAIRMQLDESNISLQDTSKFEAELRVAQGVNLGLRLAADTFDLMIGYLEAELSLQAELEEDDGT